MFYVDGKPRHITSPETSSLEIVTSDDYKKWSADKVQKKIRSKHLVITDRPVKETEFDSDGLRTLTGLSAKIPIQGKLSAFP